MTRSHKMPSISYQKKKTSISLSQLIDGKAAEETIQDFEKPKNKKFCYMMKKKLSGKTWDAEDVMENVGFN